MTIHTIVFVIVTILSLTAAYALGKPAPALPEEAQPQEAQQSGEESSTDAP
jgi:hypothetical protein